MSQNNGRLIIPEFRVPGTRTVNLAGQYVDGPFQITSARMPFRTAARPNILRAGGPGGPIILQVVATDQTNVNGQTFAMQYFCESGVYMESVGAGSGFELSVLLPAP